jgi:NitT/TauT family transport system substrate-binding protein
MKRRVALLALAALGGPRIAAAQPLRSVVVGGVVVEDTVPLWYALANGMFRAAGLSVEVRRIGGGFSAPLGIVAGVYNVVNSNLLSVIVAHARGIPLAVVAFSATYAGVPEYNALLVRKDSLFQTAADLNGRVIGSAGVNDLGSLALHSWMDRHGGDFKTLKIIEVPYSAILAALQENRIDAGATLQPYLSDALASGTARLFADTNGAIAPHFSSSGWIASPAWVDTNGETVRRFARVIHEAQLYCNAHRNQTAPILAQNTGADLSTILRGGRETYAQTVGDPKELQPVIDAAAKYGMIDHRFDAAEIISPVVRELP